MVNEQLKNLRIKNNIDAKTIANWANISLDYYYKIERGERMPSLKKAKLIADILNVSLENIFFAYEFNKMSKKQPSKKAI